MKQVTAGSRHTILINAILPKVKLFKFVYICYILLGLETYLEATQITQVWNGSNQILIVVRLHDTARKSLATGSGTHSTRIVFVRARLAAVSVYNKLVVIRKG